MKGRKVRVATVALGSRWREMILKLDRPSARAAFTYSKLRARRNSARTTCTSDTQENSSKMPSSTKKPGVRKDERMIKQIELRQRRPDLDEALEHEIDPPAEIALHRAGGDADDRGDARQNEPEQHRETEAVEQPRDDVAALIVGAEPVPFDRRAAAIRARRARASWPRRLRIAPWSAAMSAARAPASAGRDYACCRNSGSAARSSSHCALISFSIVGSR